MSSKEQYKGYVSDLKKKIKEQQTNIDELTTDVMESRKIIQGLKKELTLESRNMAEKIFKFWLPMLLMGISLGMLISFIISKLIGY